MCWKIEMKIDEKNVIIKINNYIVVYFKKFNLIIRIFEIKDWNEKKWYYNV